MTLNLEACPIANGTLKSSFDINNFDIHGINLEILLFQIMISLWSEKN